MHVCACTCVVFGLSDTSVCLSQGRLLSLLDDNTLHLWEIYHKDGCSHLEEIHSFALPGRPGFDSAKYSLPPDFPLSHWAGGRGQGLDPLWVWGCSWASVLGHPCFARICGAEDLSAP